MKGQGDPYTLSLGSSNYAASRLHCSRRMSRLAEIIDELTNMMVISTGKATHYPLPPSFLNGSYPAAAVDCC